MIMRNENVRMKMRMRMTIKLKYFLINIILSYYLFNRQEILQKAKERYAKEKTTKYYLQNKEIIKGKARNRCNNLSEEEKNKIKEYQMKRYQELIQYKKKH